MNTTRIVAAFALVLTCAASLQATVISQTLGYGPGNPNYEQTLTFNLFNPALGTLTGVKFIVELDIDGGLLRIDNDGANPASGDVSFGGKTTVTSTDVIIPGNSVTAATVAAVTADGDDGDVEVGGTGNFSQVGDDFDAVAGAPQSEMDMFSIINALFFQYIGIGTFDVKAVVDQVLVLGALGGSQILIDPLTADGTVTVEYTYDPIPTPAALPVIAAGMFLIATRRRTRA